MNPLRLLVLGGGDGWHADQLGDAAQSQGISLTYATYESLSSRIDSDGVCSHDSDGGSLQQFDAILTRTMPAGSLERITYRLAVLHALCETLPIINPPRALEVAIDKFATLAHVAALGYDVPATIVTQSRSEAIAAFQQLGGDCVIKPVFGGEGRGVMRIRDPELAWYALSTLDQLDATLYVQAFVPPGGIDTRLLVIGEEVIAIRRENHVDFRTNVRGGSRCQRIEPSLPQIDMARHIANSIGLVFAAVDVIDADDGRPRVLEVNAIPGWRSAQQAVEFSIADRLIQLVVDRCRSLSEKGSGPLEAAGEGQTPFSTGSQLRGRDG